MLLQSTINTKHFKYARFCMVSFLQTVSFVLFISLILYANSQASFFNELSTTNIYIQQNRAFALFFGYIFLISFVVLSFNIYKRHNLTKFEATFLYGSIIPIVSLFNFCYFWFKAHSESIFKKYFRYIFANSQNNKEIDFKYFFTNFKLFPLKDKVFANTLTFIFLCMVTFVTFIFISLPSDVKNIVNDPYNLWTFSKGSFFTEWTNLMCFIFCVLFFINHRWKIFNRNIYLLNLCCFIMFVFIVFWVVLIPGSFFLLSQNKFNFSNLEVTDVVSTFWFHFVTPLSFLLFTIIYIKNTKKNVCTYKCYLKFALPYILVYLFYVYTLPFISSVTVYSFLTNANPNNIAQGESKPGSYVIFLVALLAINLFSGYLYLFFRLDKRLVKGKKK